MAANKEASRKLPRECHRPGFVLDSVMRGRSAQNPLEPILKDITTRSAAYRSATTGRIRFIDLRIWFAIADFQKIFPSRGELPSGA